MSHREALAGVVALSDAADTVGRHRVNVRDVAIGSALVISLLSAFGWQWSTPGRAIRDLEARVTVEEKRTDSTERYLTVLTYMNCVRRDSTSAEARPLVQTMCTRAAEALERP